jgi:hypothetical protein
MVEFELMELAGICGLYCGACHVYRAYKDKDFALLQKLAAAGNIPVEKVACDGCLSVNYRVYLPPDSRDCEFRRCAKEKGVTWCFECSEFPCKKLEDFSRDGRAHHTAVIDNLREMKNLGVDEWLKIQEKRWQCPNCGKKLHWKIGYL